MNNNQSTGLLQARLRRPGSTRPGIRGIPSANSQIPRASGPKEGIGSTGDFLRLYPNEAARLNRLIDRARTIHDAITKKLAAEPLEPEGRPNGR